MATLTEDIVIGWLKDMGMDPMPAPDPNANWHYTVYVPPNQDQHSLEVIGPKNRPRAVIVGAMTTISPEHNAALLALDSGAKSQFVNALAAALSNQFVEFKIEQDPATANVSKFEVFAVRYDDGLTLDSFARTISSVFKTRIAGVQCIQQFLDSQPPGGGELAFHKPGIQ